MSAVFVSVHMFDARHAAVAASVWSASSKMPREKSLTIDLEVRLFHYPTRSLATVFIRGVIGLQGRRRLLS